MQGGKVIKPLLPLVFRGMRVSLRMFGRNRAKRGSGNHFVVRSFLILTPNFEDVSMNLSWTFSKSLRDVWTMRDFRIVITRFLVPGIDPLRTRKSFLTIP